MGSVPEDSEAEIIDIEGDSDDDGGSGSSDDNEDLYEDYDELADLAVTASEEPPPPGTRPLQEELLTLITENTVPGVTINKDDVVAWLRNEEATLTGEIVPDRVVPSAVSSYDKLSDDDVSLHTRSDVSSPERRLISSVAVKPGKERKSSTSERRRRTRRVEESRSHRSSHRRSELSHGSRESRHRSRRTSSVREERSRSIAEGVSQERPVKFQRSLNRDHREDAHSLHRTITSHRREKHHASGHRPEQRHTGAEQRHTGAEQRRHSGAESRRHSGADQRRHVEQKRQVRSRHGSRSPLSHRRSIERRVKLQRRVDDDTANSSAHYHKKISSQVSKVSSVKSVRDARELLSEKRTTIPVTDYVESLKEQIRTSEINARNIFKELQSAKKDLLTYLQQNTGMSDNYREQECSSRHDHGNRKRKLDERSRGHGGGRRGSRVERRRPRGKSTSPGSRRSSSSPDRGSDHPEDWVILAPSQVDGFNCGGPAIFVQNFSKDVTRKDLYSHFYQFGSIMDVKKLHIGKKRSACVIFSRQSEADKVLRVTPTSSSRNSPQQDDGSSPPKQNTFDRLLTALKGRQENDEAEEVIIL